MFSAGNQIVVPADTASSPLGDPAWFLDRLDFANEVAVFTRTSRAALSEAPFLDHRWGARGAEQRELPLERLLEFHTAAPPPAIIWHSAFCCSTLVASCLDAPGTSLALKEPAALVDLSDARRTGDEAADRALAAAVFARLGLGFGSGERVVIKPSNGAQSVMPDAVRIGAPMLLLYSRLRDFLLSIVGGGMERGGAETRRKFARDLMVGRVLAQRPSLRVGLKELCAMTDLQVAAILWHVQVAEFRAAARAAGPDQARSLDCEMFLADPARALAAIDDFLDLGLGETHTRQVAGGAHLDRHAKEPGVAFDAGERRRGFLRLEEEWGPLLDALVAWSYESFPETPQGDPVGAPLLTAET